LNPATTPSFPPFTPVLSLIQRHAELTTPAVTHAGVTSSYAALWARIARWAGLLCARGARKGRVVGIALDRSAESLVAMLAVVRTGAAYVPLDLSAPAERNALFVRDSGISLLVVALHEVNDGLSAPAVVTVSELDAAPAATLEPHCPGPDDPFYVAYTSGSTGKPRGVTVTHANIAWYACMMPHAFDRRATDRFAVTTPLTFATSVRQTFVPLALGAHTTVATDAQSRDARELLEFLKRERITVWEVVPSMLRACVDLLRHMPTAESRRLLANSLRQVGCIGEPLPVGLVREWKELGGPGSFTNSYGQSEASGLAVWPVDEATMSTGGMVPAGRPTPGNAIRIVGADALPVPDGETGEIVAEGPAVALGYRRTDEGEGRFGMARDGTRTFRTGDVGRWRPDGALEVLGRLDDQLKVRGVRVDPFEVESVLRTHPAVRAAAVAVHERNGEGVLVAYVSCVYTPPSAAEFRRVLRARLTAAMVPACYVQLPELPRTATGKLDRRALPNPFVSAGQEAPSVRSTATITGTIAEVWKQVLGVAEVRPHDDFFELGGSSFTGAQVVERLESEFGIRLTLTTLLNHPTIEDLADTLSIRGAEPRDLAMVSLRSGDARPAVLCVPGLKGRAAGMVALSQHLSGARPVYAIDAEHADLSGLSVTDVASRYASLALATHPGPYCVVGFSFGGVFAFETVRALRAAGAEVAQLVLLDAIVPRTAAIGGVTRAMVAAEEYLSLTSLRVQRSMRDPLLYVRKLLRPAAWQEFRRSIRIGLGDYVATPISVPTLFVYARSLPFVRGRMRVWQALTGEFRSRSVWADHNHLITEPTAARVGQLIEQELEALEAR
jgi:amino acid adenylation domain-containing protein